MSDGRDGRSQTADNQNRCVHVECVRDYLKNTHTNLRREIETGFGRVQQNKYSLERQNRIRNTKKPHTPHSPELIIKSSTRDGGGTQTSKLYIRMHILDVCGVVRCCVCVCVYIMRGAASVLT